MFGLTSFIMGIVNSAEVIIIIAIIAVVIFGAKKIPELARAFGRASTEYEKAKIEAKREIEKVRNQGTNRTREKLETIADTLGIDYTNKNDDDLRNAIDSKIKNEK